MLFNYGSYRYSSALDFLATLNYERHLLAKTTTSMSMAMQNEQKRKDIPQISLAIRHHNRWLNLEPFHQPSRKFYVQYPQ